MISRIYTFFHRLFANPEERGKYSSGYWQNKVRQEALNLCQGIKGRILEIGCGEGLFLAQLAGQNPHLEFWGIDNHAIRLKQAGEHFGKNNLRNINLSLQEATKLSFKDGYFDTVVCINTICNLESLEVVKIVLREMFRVCKTKGRVIFDFRNSANPLMRWQYKLAPFYDQTVKAKNLPLKTYSLAELRLILEELGLNITHRRYIGFPIKRIAPIVILEAEKL